MKRRTTIGLLIDQLVSGYARLLIDGVTDGSRRQQVNLIVFSGRVLGSPLGFEYQNNVIFDFIGREVIDALVVAAGTQGTYLPSEQIHARLRGFEGIPLLSIGARFPGVPCVLTENREGILQTVQHLVDEHGMRRIAFLRGPQSNQDAEARFSAYREAVRAHGIDDDPALWLQADFSAPGAQKALADHLRGRHRPDFGALVAANDAMAIAAMQSLREQGLAIPGDVAVTGFDDIPESQFLSPSMTTVGHRVHDIGATAASMAVRMAQGEAVLEETVLPAELVLRTSCGCLPRSVLSLGDLPARPPSRGGSRRGKGAVVDRCLARLQPPLPRFSRTEEREVLETLVDAAATDRFLRVLQGALNDAVADRIDLAPWRDLLTALGSSLLEDAGSTQETLRLQSLFLQAAVLLSEMLRGEQGMRVIELQAHLTQLRRAMEGLISGESIQELMNDIAEELDRLDIRTCSIVCYPEVRQHRRGERWKIPATAQIMLARMDGKRIALAPPQNIFPPGDGFIPARLLPDGRPFVLIATATFFREDQIGYIAFEPGRRDYAIYETFSVQLSSLLKGSRMFDELTREKALMSILMDTVPDHIYFKDEASRFLLVNRSMAAALGLGSPHEAAGRTDFDYFADEHARSALEVERRIIASGAPLVDAEEKETWPDGRVTWVATTRMPLRDPGGAIIGTFGLSRDITERRRSEEKILRLAALVESSQEAIFGVDSDGRVTTWNRGASTAFGYAAEEVVGTSVFALLQDSAPERQRTAWERAAGGTLIPPFEGVGRRKDGSLLPLTIALSPIREPRGAVVGLAVVARDMTRENAIQARLIQAQRLESLGTLAAGVAHQFNNINMVIKGYLDALATVDSLPPSAAVFAAEALRGVDRLVDITDRMQGLTGAQHGGQDTCRLNEVARAQLPHFEARMAAMGATLTLDLRETPSVRMHGARAGFLLSSLVGNALDALTGVPVRNLAIRTGVDAKNAFLDVVDTGCGIHRADIPKLFTPFYSTKGEWAGPGSAQAALRGIGLSLSICRSIVSESGGRIEVESEPGTGSTFHVWLPAAEEQPDQGPS